MTGSEFITRIFPYVAMAMFLAGTAWRFVHWLTMPKHLKWTLHPVPKGLTGQLTYMLREIFTFETLYRFNRRLWVGTFCMHMAMLGAVVFLALNLAGFTQGFPVRYCLWLLAVSVLYVFWLRMVDGNLRVLSTFEEYFNLAFLAAVATAGLLASAPHASSSLRAYLLGLLKFEPGAVVLAWDQLLAISLAGLFLIYLPWSKMIHYVSKYFTYHHINWQKE